jgi:hypothetical protein
MSEDGNLVSLRAHKAEQETADLHRKAVAEALAPVAAACNAARADGFYVEFGMQMDQFGRYYVSPIGIIKRL